MNKVLLGAVLIIAATSAAAAQTYPYYGTYGYGDYGPGYFPPGLYNYVGEPNVAPPIAYGTDVYGAQLAVLPVERTRPRQQRGADTMNAAKIILALTLLAGVTAISFLTPMPSFAQSQPNYGPNSPGGGDTFGEPYSGTAAARQKSGGW